MAMRSTRRRTISTAQCVLMSVFLGISAFSAESLPSPEPYPVLCQTAESCFHQAVNPESRPPASVVPESYSIANLKKVQDEFPGTVWADRAGVHLGLMLKDTSPADAIAYFRQANETFPLLQDYLQLWLAQTLLNAHRPHEAAKVLEGVETWGSQSRLRLEALVLAGQAWRESGDCELAIRWYSRAIRSAPQSSQAASALLEIGKCYVELGKMDDAQKALREVWWKVPHTSEGREAQKLLEQLPEENQRKPTLDEEYKRTLAFYRAAQFEQAIIGLRGYLQQISPGKKYHEAEYKLGMALARLKQYDKAEKVFDRVSRSQSSRKQDGVVWLARSYLRQGKGPEVLALHKQAHLKGLSGDRQSLLHIFAGVFLHDQAKTEPALAAFQQAFQSARSSQRRQDALWRMTWIYYEQEQYEKVLATLKTLGESSRDYDVRRRVQYWQGRIYAQLQQADKAQAVYQKLVQEQPLTYYGQLAKARVLQSGSMKNVGLVKHETHPASSAVSPDLLKDLHYQKARELLTLGLLPEAAKEVKGITKRATSKTANLVEIISLAQQTGAYDFGIRLAIRHFGQKMKQDLIPRSSYAWNGAYPIGYIPTIQQHAPAGLDPYLVAGLIREESLYDARAMSRVGARGLMQLMPATAKKVASQLGVPSPQKDDLFDAKTNIQLGTTYVGQLLAQFNGNLVHTVAAYNAGPHVVRRWIAQDPQADPDEFVERISYRETRGYVKRVLGSYRVYRELLAHSCQADSLDRMC
ncbi:lytic transglycosylase domain-containing protein [Nitrospira sp. M1]